MGLPAASHSKSPARPVPSADMRERGVVDSVEMSRAGDADPNPLTTGLAGFVGVAVKTALVTVSVGAVVPVVAPCWTIDAVARFGAVIRARYTRASVAPGGTAWVLTVNRARRCMVNDATGLRVVSAPLAVSRYVAAAYHVGSGTVSRFPA